LGFAEFNFTELAIACDQFLSIFAALGSIGAGANGSTAELDMDNATEFPARFSRTTSSQSQRFSKRIWRTFHAAASIRDL
jgi:hypothetical protein